MQENAPYEIMSHTKEGVTVNTIIFPLKLRMKAAEVRDLQVALQMLLDKDTLLADDEGARRELSAALKLERAKQTYGAATRKLVSIFQKERRLEASGSVDEPTVDALNGLLGELSDPGQVRRAYVVKGVVRFFDGFPAAGVMVSAFDRHLRTEQALGQSQTEGRGAYRCSIPGVVKAEKPTLARFAMVRGSANGLCGDFQPRS